MTAVIVGVVLRARGSQKNMEYINVQTGRSLVRRDAEAVNPSAGVNDGHGSPIVRPRSTTIWAPVTNDASSLSRNRTTVATSSARPRRPIGVLRASFVRISAIDGTIGVDDAVNRRDPDDRRPDAAGA
jgi:hypothetical protein